jgi:hypothetical protein
MARLTIPDEITSQTFTVTTSTSSFPISFSLPSGKADLRVKVGDSVLSTSSFSFAGTLLEGGGYDGGTVTLNTAAANTTVIIERRTKIQRVTNFAPASAAPVQSVDSELNRLTAIAQDINRRLESGEGGGGGGGTVEFATFTEMQAGGVEDKAVAPLVMIEGVPAVYRDVICDVRPDPATANDTGGILAAFNGEKTYAPVRIRSRLRTSTILGQPTTGYHYTVDTIPVRVWLNNNSGYNHATDSNVGRTAAAAVRVNATTGTSVQGDTMCFSASGFVQGARSGATSFLANPASVLYAGDINAGANGVYANPREIIINDNGYDIAAIGDVLNLNRTNATGALKATWIGLRVQSVGSQPIDGFFSARGASKWGLDFATATFTRGAIALAAGQAIHFNAANSTSEGFPDDTTASTTYLTVNASTGNYEFWRAGSKVAEIGSAGLVGAGGRGVATLTANATTWTITTANVLYVTNNSTATLVTGIASGLPNGTEFTVHFNDANTTLDSNIVGGFSLNSFLDVTPPLGAVMTFVKTADYILETGRSFGGLVPGFFTFPDGFSTPEVQSGRPHYKASNTSATTITNFLLGNGSQQITILATNDNTTIQHNGTTISLIGGVSTVIPSGHTMTLIRDGSLWREINRTFPVTGWGSLNSGTTPSIVGLGENIVMVHGGSTSITNFVGGSNGRMLRLHFTNSNVTLVNGSSLNLRGGSNVTPGNNNVITLIRDYVGNWVEVSRNF